MYDTAFVVAAKEGAAEVGERSAVRHLATLKAQFKVALKLEKEQRTGTAVRMQATAIKRKDQERDSKFIVSLLHAL